MLIQEYGQQYRHHAAASRIAVPAETPLGETAAQIREMILCYASDGEHFFHQGDWVNAAASFAYGFGWLDAGICLGYLTGPVAEQTLALDPAGLPDLTGHLQEKTIRYNRMLTAALTAVIPAPDPETAMYRAYLRIHGTAENYRISGEMQYTSGNASAALAAFSYGYGWLDCGVRAGLAEITGDRHLFTI